MSQNDLVIANQTFPTTRADINSALQALGSLSSGATEPPTTYANMLWYDTANNTLKMRAEANDAWISVGYLDQSTDAFRILDDTQVVNTSGTQTGLIGDQATATWEAGTSTTESLVSPAKVKAAIESVSPLTTTSGTAPYLAARAFVFIEDGSNAANTYHGQNIASVVRNSTGLYTITFTTAMPDANYAVSAHGGSQSYPNNGYGMIVGFEAKSASSFRVRTRRVTNHDIFDCDQMSFVVFA